MSEECMANANSWDRIFQYCFPLEPLELDLRKIVFALTSFLGGCGISFVKFLLT